MIFDINNDLYKVLSDLKVISQKDLDRAFQDSKVTNNFYDILISRELITDENLGKTMSDIYKIPLVRLSNTEIEDEALKVIPEIVAKKHKIIAFGHDKKGLKLAMFDPTNTEIVAFISKKAGLDVQVFFSTKRDVENAFKEYSKDMQKNFEEILKGRIEEAGKGQVSEVRISEVVDTLVRYAYENKASDIHIEPMDETSLVRFRIDGVLHDVINLPNTLHNQITTRIKVLAKLRTDEHLSAQDGKMQLDLEQEDLDIRVSIVPIVAGEKCVLRLLSSKSRQFSLQELGMSETDLEKVRKAYAKPTGMVLSTGPTGSGKTTTIYGIVKILNTRDVNIATIEDPVEYEIQGINQIQVNAKTNLTFAQGLRSILRQDPNIIFVGEIRDEETAGIAINSALTGHLVLSTLHTNDAPTTLPRLIDMNIEPFLVASTVNAIIAQRLVRKICDKCKVSKTVPITELKKLYSESTITKHFGKHKEVRLYEGKGCDVCHHSGYTGRVGLFEVIEMSPEIRELVVQKADSELIRKKAISEGMSTMFMDGMDKVERGLTTIEEIMRVTKI